MPLAAGVVLAEGGERAKHKYRRDDKGLVHRRSPLLSRLSCITQKRDDFRRIVIPLWLIEHDVSGHRPPTRSNQSWPFRDHAQSGHTRRRTMTSKSPSWARKLRVRK